MSGEAWLYLLAVLINAVNLFLQVFFTIMYSDLEWYVCLQASHCAVSDPGVAWGRFGTEGDSGIRVLGRKALGIWHTLLTCGFEQ